MKYREFTFTHQGKLIARFFKTLGEDYHFNLNEPMTDTYVQEVCYEAGFNKEETIHVIDLLNL